MTVYAERRKRLLALAKGKQVVAMTGANIYYLTDFWGSGAALVLPDKTVVFTSPLEADRAGELGKEVEVVVAPKWTEVPGALLKRLSTRSAIVDDDSGLRPLKKFTFMPSLFLEARRVKDAAELGRINKASQRIDRIFAMLSKELKPGMTEWEAAAKVMMTATADGLTPSGSDSALSPTIIASGENGALPHSELTGRKIKSGDFVVADIFFRYQGYNSDETRTFAVGGADAEMKKNYAIVLAAQEAALDAIREGAVCGDVHEAAVAVLRRDRVDKFLNHSVGHGVGIDIHELPRIAKGEKSRLVSGDVVTNEPGIYFPGKYGIRIEDTVVVKKRGVQSTRFTKDLLVLG